jgi:hypothetical protein
VISSQAPNLSPADRSLITIASSTDLDSPVSQLEMKEDIPEGGFRDLDGNVYDSKYRRASWRGPKAMPHPNQPLWRSFYELLRKQRAEKEQQAEEKGVQDGFNEVAGQEAPVIDRRVSFIVTGNVAS